MPRRPTPAPKARHAGSPPRRPAPDGPAPRAALLDRLRESAFFDELARHGRLESCVLLFERPYLGDRDEAFGRGLLTSLLYVLSEKEAMPSTIVLLAGAATLACDGSAALRQLTRMAEGGVSVLVCGASLNRARRRAALRVGEAVNMHDIAEVLLRSSRVITL